MSDSIVILSAKRTPIGHFQGQFSKISATELGTSAIASALSQSQLSADAIDACIMGCVLPAGLGQAPARQSALGAKLPFSTECTTINKMCGSGMKAVMFAHDSIIAGSSEIVIAGGMENMTRAPYLLQKARSGYRVGNGTIYDHMFLDGLEDIYDKGTLMGVFAEDCAKEFNFSREDQDQFAICSVERAQKAQAENLFKDEIVALNDISEDEGPLKAKCEKIPKLKSAFIENGTITAANSSSISDGAAALVLCKESQAKSTPLAKIIAHSTHAQKPAEFTVAPIEAIKKLLKKCDWSINDVDLFEINEAFAVVTMATMKALKIDHAKVNVHGGACVLGHPVGATGARILTTLIYALKQRNLKKGIACLCIGGGEATAIAIEIM